MILNNGETIRGKCKCCASDVKGGPWKFRKTNVVWCPGCTIDACRFYVRSGRQNPRCKRGKNGG